MSSTAGKIILGLGKAILVATATITISTLANRVLKDSTNDIAEGAIQLFRFAKNGITANNELEA